jgi:hypothetical protein
VSKGSHAAERRIVEVRGSRALHALVAAAATATAAAYVWRATQGGGWLAWVVASGLAGIALLHGAGWWDARTPRLVADDHGVRVRTGRTWTGTPWSQVDSLEVGSGTGPLRDGRLRIRTEDQETLVRYRERSRTGASDLAEDLRSLGAPLVDPVSPPAPQPRPAAPVPLAPVHDAPDVRRAIRADVRRDGPRTVGMLALQPEPALLPEITELRGTNGRVGLVLETVVEATGTASVPDTAVDAAPVDPYPTRPAAEPVIGPQLAAARERVGLSVDQLADRTRIRPHVIESIEVDDFVPCGGDFYARGHLRALARTLGLDHDPLVAAYDETYASAPIAARRVFEAELASGPAPSLRMTRGGPNWAALLGMVMVLAIVWAVAKVLMTSGATAPAPLDQPASGPTAAASAPADRDRFAGLGAPALNRLRLSAQGGTSAVTVRDEAGEVVWRGTLDAGEGHTVRVTGSATVVAADGGVIVASMNGQPRGPLGDAGQAVQRVIGAARSR